MQISLKDSHLKPQSIHPGLTKMNRPQVVVLLILLIAIISASCREQVPEHVVHHSTGRKSMKVVVSTRMEESSPGLGMKLYPTGSNLPDCSHACGPCMPCKRVMVSFKCSMESCPVIYRCVCKGKYYHVPSP